MLINAATDDSAPQTATSKTRLQAESIVGLLKFAIQQLSKL